MKAGLEAQRDHTEPIDATDRNRAGTSVTDFVGLVTGGVASLPKQEPISDGAGQRKRVFWSGKETFVVRCGVRCLSVFASTPLVSSPAIASSVLAASCAPAHPLCQTPAATGRIRS